MTASFSVLPPTLDEVVAALRERLPGLVVAAGPRGPRRGGSDGVLRIGRRALGPIVTRRLPVHARGLVRHDGGLIDARLHLPVPYPEVGAAPDHFRPLAVLAVRNEDDILGWVLDEMMDVEGLDVFVIDNHSTDGTTDVLRSRTGHPRFSGWTSHPDEPDEVLDWSGLLARKQEVIGELQPTWAIHSDADEVRRSPWPGISMRDGLWAVHQSGATMVDFTVLNHLPVHGHTPDDRTDVTRLDHVEFGLRPGYFTQTKCWRVPTAGEPAHWHQGGHRITPPIARPFPLNFRVDHYPVRSQSHGLEKILVDGRWTAKQDARDRAQSRYGHVDAEHDFEREPNSLPRKDPPWFQAAAWRLVCRAGMDPDPDFRLV